MLDNFLLNPEIQGRFLDGLLVTLWISALSALLAVILGCMAAYLRMSAVKPLRVLGTAYVELFRNTPLLIQLYVFYRGLSSVGVMLPPELCGILALGLYAGAYVTEVFRSGLLALPKEQLDAGLALGLSRWEVYTRILLPQAVRVILPPLGNQFVNIAKNSSLVAFITVSDLFHVVYKGAVDEFRPIEFFVEGMALYLAVSLTISGMVHAVDAGMNRKRRQSGLKEAQAYG